MFMLKKHLFHTLNTMTRYVKDIFLGVLDVRKSLVFLKSTRKRTERMAMEWLRGMRLVKTLPHRHRLNKEV